jgi:hypothetical protein
VGAKSIRSAVLALALAFACLAPLTAAPGPALVTKSWEFKFSYHTPRAIAVQNIRGEWEWYWFMTYKVVNNTGQERLFIPEITIATDAGDIIQAGKGVRTAVFDAVKKRVGNRLLESPTDVVGQFRQDEDNAKESVAIWPATKHNVDQISVFISGLSGETAVVKVPDPADTTKTIDALVTKTLMVDYELPGAPLSPQEQAVVPKGSRWIMR